MIDHAHWDELVERYSGLLWSVARAHRLSHADAADVVQTTWLRLVENLDRIRDPERVGGWLATTARRECLRTIRLRSRQEPTDDVDLFEEADAVPVDQAILVEERDGLLWRAFRTLGERCQELLRLLAAPTEPSYEEISAALDMPIGAIGPTRGRCLEQLRVRLAGMGAT